MENLDRALFAYLRRPRRRRLAKLIRAAHPLVWATALKATGNPEDAHDICQEVFLGLLLRPPSARAVESARGYLIWTVIGRVTNFQRANGRRRRREKEGGLLAQDDGLTTEDVEKLRIEVGRLEEELRAVVELRYFAGVRNRDIAAILGVSERQVERRLQMAREKLRSRLEGLAPAVVPFLERDIEPSKLSPPADLLPSLLTVARVGAALGSIGAPGSTAISLGGIVMTKKTVVGIMVAVALTGGYGIWRSVEPPDPSEPIVRSVKSSPAAGQPRDEVRPVSGSTTVAIDPTAEVTGPPRASVYGTVKDQEELPVPGAWVLLAGEIDEEKVSELDEAGYGTVKPGLLRFETTADEDGHYEFQDVLPADFRVYAETETLLTCWVSDTKLEPGQRLERNPMLCPARRITGSIETADGAPIDSAVFLVDINYAWNCREHKRDGQYKHFPVDSHGRFDTGFRVADRGMPRIELAALAPGYAARQLWVEPSDFADRQAELGIILEPEYRTTVRVVDAEGFPLEGTLVSVNQNSIRDPLTDSDGWAAPGASRRPRADARLQEGGLLREESAAGSESTARDGDQRRAPPAHASRHGKGRLRRQNPRGRQGSRYAAGPAGPGRRLRLCDRLAHCLHSGPRYSSLHTPPSGAGTLPAGARAIGSAHGALPL